jgi:hypothetical protein
MRMRGEGVEGCLLASLFEDAKRDGEGTPPGDNTSTLKPMGERKEGGSVEGTG